MDLENQYGTKEIQIVLLALLKEFDSFCKKEDIKYSLDSGSLLGAVRHNGFIPWDDDLDIVVNRTNYNKIVEKVGQCENLLMERNTTSTLWVDRIRLKNTVNYGKYSPTIDVFILDHVPNNKLFAKIKLFIITLLQGMMKPHANYNKGSWLLKFCSFITHIMGRLLPRNVIFNYYHKVSQWGNSNHCQFSSCYNYDFDYLGILYHSIGMESIIRHCFEDTEVSITSDYDYHLKQLYGDYMTPPKLEDRYPVHIGK